VQNRGDPYLRLIRIAHDTVLCPQRIMSAWYRTASYGTALPVPCGPCRHIRRAYANVPIHGYCGIVRISTSVSAITLRSSEKQDKPVGAETDTLKASRSGIWGKIILSASDKRPWSFCKTCVAMKFVDDDDDDDDKGAWGSVVSSLSGVRGRAPAENNFSAIKTSQNASRCTAWDQLSAKP